MNQYNILFKDFSDSYYLGVIEENKLIKFTSLNSKINSDYINDPFEFLLINVVETDDSNVEIIPLHTIEIKKNDKTINAEYVKENPIEKNELLNFLNIALEKYQNEILTP